MHFCRFLSLPGQPDACLGNYLGKVGRVIIITGDSEVSFRWQAGTATMTLPPLRGRYGKQADKRHLLCSGGR